MMKLLIMCEGSNELAVIKMLLDADCMKFSKDDLVNLMPFHARQIEKSAAVKNALNIYTGKFGIFRIGDKMSDALKIPKDYEDRVVFVEKYCTKPELEMLFIIAENLTDDYNKVKSSVKPKDFCKKNIIFNKKRYDNSTEFYNLYFGNNINLLVDSIKKYSEVHKTHKNDEHYLIEILK